MDLDCAVICHSTDKGKWGIHYNLQVYVDWPIQDFFRVLVSQVAVKSTVFGVFENLKFKISEGYNPNWCFPDSAQLAVSAILRQLTGQSQENINLGRSLLKFLN